MEVVSTVVSIISCLCTPNCLNEESACKCKYLRGREEKSKDLEKKMEQLRAQAADIERKLKAAYVQDGKESNAVVTQWLKDFQTIGNDVQGLIEKVGQEQRYLNGCFPNYRSRMKLGKEIEVKTNTVNNHLVHGQDLNRQLPDSQEEKEKPFPQTKLVGNKTAEIASEKIWKYIMDDSIGMIGVYGMGGVGKTTIMKSIYNRLVEGNRCFDIVIWVTVSKDCNLEKLQNDIGKELNLNYKDETDRENRARELFAALSRRKKFMLILDDMWEEFSLENVGVLNPTRENGCKLVLTTRSRTVCRRMTQKEVEVKVLSKEEAWDLFKNEVGENVLNSSGIQGIAKNVAKECSGLPLALITVGRALRQVDDVFEWENALNELRAPTADIEGLEDKVFGSLKYSYTKLSNQTQACFLYCALYPEDGWIEVENLIEHWIDEEGLIPDLEHREAQICKGKTILNKLKDACMLENFRFSPTRECVKMHDLIRDLAIRIQSNTCLIKARVGLRTAPRDEEWLEEVKRVSLMKNGIEQLIGKPKCPNLSSLLLQHNYHLRDISPSFFQHMCNLRVVNLSYTDMEFLPESLFDLENLRALLLNNCKKLKKLPSVAKFKSLRTLDLSDSSIIELPAWMEMLVNLRHLDLWKCKLNMFPVKLLQKLTLLEELSVMCETYLEGGGEFDGEKLEGEKKESKGEEKDEAEVVFVKKLINDTNLRRLDVNFKNSKNFNRYIRSERWQQLARFTLSSNTKDSSRSAGNNCISIDDGDIIEGETCLVLPNTTHELVMRNCDTLTRLSMCLPKSSQLQKCTLQGCNDMECIVMAGENSLPSLPRMDLQGLPKLSSLCKGVVAPGTLSSLKELKVRSCKSMKNLLTRGLLQHLKSLEDIFVERCSEMEEIIVGIMGEEDGDEKEKGEAGMMSGGGNKNEGNNNNNNSIITLPSPTSLPGDNNYLPSLQKIHLRRLPKLRSLCKGVVAPGTLSSLKVLHVVSCNNMKNLLTRGLLQHLQSLEKIMVFSCSRIEEIIGGEGEEDDKERGGEEGNISSGTINNNAIITAILPRLQSLVLIDLPELKSICSSRGVMVCNSLQSIRVSYCPKLKKLGIVSMEENDNNGGRTLMGAPPGVKKIIGNNKKWWDPQTSDHPDAHTFLQPFIT